MELWNLVITEPLVAIDVLGGVAYQHRSVRLQELRHHPYDIATPQKPVLLSQESSGFRADLVLEVLKQLLGDAADVNRQRS
eukprot:11899684-Alexandrium_andersonii.AAC.1